MFNMLTMEPLCGVILGNSLISGWDQECLVSREFSTCVSRVGHKSVRDAIIEKVYYAKNLSVKRS